MEYLGFVVLIVPAAIGIIAALWLGPNRGTLLGGAATPSGPRVKGRRRGEIPF